jgi:hypothetical protein
MNARQVGLLLGCSEAGVAPDSLPYLEGFATKLASSDHASVIGRRLADLGYQALCRSGREFTAPAFHLRMVKEAKDWSPHHQEVVDDVTRTVMALEPLKKMAFSDAMSGAGLALKGIGYGSLGLGAGAGALYWLLSRHANQDSADLEAMQKQVEYYNELGRELEESMRRKYRYDQVDERAAQI